MSTETLQRLGITIAIFPATGFGAAAAALEGAYGYLLAHGSSRDIDVAMFDIEKMNELMGFEDVWAFERRWAAGVEES